MEEEKAAAYYDELTRKGGGAARFKQGLGFSAASDAGNVPARGLALPSSSSSFLSNFVKASSPSKASELEKQAQLESIQNKLKKKKKKEKEKRSPSRDEEDRDKARVSRRDDRQSSRRRSRSSERERERRIDRHSSLRSRSRERYRERRRRSRSRSDSDGDRRRRERRRSRSSSPRNRRAERRSRSRSRSSSPRRRAQRRIRSPSPGDRRSDKDRKVRKERNGGVDYSRLIEGYEKMSPAERIKAKMKLQLAETVEKDATKGSSGWERFEFNKDAPLDDEDTEAAEDDTELVKHIGQSFRFSAVEAKREEQIRAAHDEAIFGAPVVLPSIATNDEPDPKPESEPENGNETDEKESNGCDLAASLLSEKVLAKQQGSWRDRARRQRN